MSAGLNRMGNGAIGNDRQCTQNQGKKEDFYEYVTTSMPWRWSIGRGSYLTRFCFVNLIFSGLQTLKMGAKIIVSIVTLGQLGRLAKLTNIAALKSWTFHGLARDGIVLLGMGHNSGLSLWRVVWAPPEKYDSLLESFAKSFEIVFIGSYHQENALCLTGEAGKTQKCWDGFKRMLKWDPIFSSCS